jgi:hypothetical protein
VSTENFQKLVSRLGKASYSTGYPHTDAALEKILRMFIVRGVVKDPRNR